MSDANTRQVGGDHYRKHGKTGEQHWDRVWRLFGPGYFVGCITKYVERYRDKNGVEDLKKAAHFIQKLIELEESRDPQSVSGTRVPDGVRPAEGAGPDVSVPPVE